MIKRSTPWTSQPQYPAKADPKWIARGLKAFYILNANLWRTNIVTGLSNATATGSGHTFHPNKIRTSGAADTYITLPFDGFSAVAPFTIIVGSRHISGVVSWSVLRFNVAWYGIYEEAGTSFKTSDNNSFDGLITPVAGGAVNPIIPYKAVTTVGTNNLRGCINGGAISVDTAMAVPTGGGLTAAYLGASYLNGAPAASNQSVTEFTHFGIFNGALTDAELQSLSLNPWQVIQPQQRNIYVSAAAGPNIVTLDPATLNFSAQDTQNTVAATLSAATADLVAQPVQPLLASTLTADALNFTAQDVQNSVTNNLTAAAFDFVAQDITAENVGAAPTVTLDPTTFNFVANDTQNLLHIDLSTATMDFVQNDVQPLLVQELTTGTFDFVGQDVQSLNSVLLETAIFDFVARSIQAGDPLNPGAGRATNLMLMGVGN